MRCRGLVDDRHSRRRFPVKQAEIPPRDDGDSQGGKITGPDDFHIGGPAHAGPRVFAPGQEHIAGGQREGCILGEGGGIHARRLAGNLQRALLVFAAAVFRVGLISQVEADRPQVCRVESGIQLVCVPDAAHEQAGSD